MNTTSFVTSEVLQLVLTHNDQFKQLTVSPRIVPFFNKALQHVALQLIGVCAKPNATPKDMQLCMHVIFDLHVQENFQKNGSLFDDGKDMRLVRTFDVSKFAMQVAQRTSLTFGPYYPQLWNSVNVGVRNLLSNFPEPIIQAITHVLAWLAEDWIWSGADATVQNDSHCVWSYWLKRGLRLDDVMWNLQAVQEHVHLLTGQQVMVDGKPVFVEFRAEDEASHIQSSGSNGSNAVQPVSITAS